MPVLRRAVRWLRPYRGAALAAFLTWAAIISMGAQARPATARWVTIPSLGDVLLVMLAIWCLGALLFYIWIATAPTDDNDDAERRPAGNSTSIRWLLGLALFVAALAWLVPRGTPPVAEEAPAREAVPNFGVLEPDPAAADEPVDATLTGTQLVGLVAFVGCATAAVVWIRRRMPAAPTSESAVDGDTAPIDTVVARVADQLRLGDDPRSAVLLAYAELERGLASSGHPRRPSETPSEHIRRVMRLEPIDGSALVDLAHLYERARFSEHVVTVADQQAASVALERLRAVLEVSS